MSQTNEKRKNVKNVKSFYRDSYSRKENTDEFDKEIVKLEILDDERFQYQMKNHRKEYPNIIYCTAYNKTEHTYEDVHWFLKNLIWKN